VHADVVSNHRSQILASYDTDVVARQHLPNPTSSELVLQGRSVVIQRPHLRSGNIAHRSAV
jgi:hypothetical protein